MDGIISENKNVIVFTLLVLLAGSVAYVTFGGNFSMLENKKSEMAFLGDSKFKVAFDSESKMNLFVSTRNNALSSLKTTEGNPIPEENTMVIGNSQAALMKSKGKTSEAGGNVQNYFGINTTIEGVLAKTNGPVDYLHFLSASEFEQVEGDSKRIFVRITPEGMPKLFFKLGLDEKLLQENSFAKGSMKGYEPHNLDGSIYYPIILGSKEAELMQNEKIFADTGDPIRNFFKKNFVVAGILKETNSSIDWLYFVPLDEIDIKAE